MGQRSNPDSVSREDNRYQLQREGRQRQAALCMSPTSQDTEVLPHVWLAVRRLTAVSPNHRPSPPLYPLSPSCGYRQHFPAPTAAPGAPYPRFTHPSLMLGSGVPGHPAAIPHPAIVPSSGKQELQPYDRNLKTQADTKAEKEAKKPVIKKPLNAFMLYMKEMRAKVIAECTLKESAAINQILGRRWHALSREEQAKYYELARKERQLHMQLYPGWSARDNYGKKKRRSREKHQESTTGGKRNAFGTYPEKAAAPAPFLPMTVL